MAAVNVITNSQLQSIKEKISPPQSTDKTKYLLALHEKSKLRAEGWPNTLEAQRHRKDRARKERLAALEAVRQQQDRVTASEREKERRTTLERVNKMMFHETDSAKGFHSAALHCDVLAERAAQIELKQQIATLRSAQEEAFHRQMKEQVELAEDAEVAKLMDARDRAMQQKAAQMQQLEEMKARILADRAANKAEGEELKARAREEMREDQEKAADARARAQAAIEDSARANEALKAYKKQQEKVAADQEAARIAYLEQKDRLAAERKAREDAIAAEKEARRKAMVEIMESKFREFMSSEADRLDRDIKHAEEKHAADAEARAARRRDLWRAICESRTQQLANRKAQRHAALEADKAFAAAWKERMQQLVEEELAEAEAKRARNVHVAAFQKHQSDLKVKKKSAMKHAALQEAAMIEELSKESQTRFQKYAKEFIEEYQRQGKPIKPMQIKLNKPRALESA